MGGATRFFLLLTTPFPLISPRPSLLRLRLGLARPPRLPPSSLAPLSTSTLSPPSPRRRRLFPTVKSSSQQFHSQTNTNTVGDDHFGDTFPSSSSSPWPEWSRLVERLASTGYFNRAVEDDEFVAIDGLSDDFVKAARACLSFARDRPNLIWSLSGRDIDVVIGNESAFLFKNGSDSARKMRTFLGGNEINVLESDKACTVDLMRFLLSYTSNPAESLKRNSLYNKELVESSIRSLLREMANAMYSPPHSDLSGSVLKQFPESCGQTSRSFGQNIEMKRGDWVCPRCTFMNFARNVKCLECEEARPKRQLSGGEWECPQCDFFNYGKNLVCLRCDCKRPGEVSFSINNSRSGVDGRYANKVDVDSRLAANEEKAERWFSKVSQLDSTSENIAIADDDFPEIMPLRKGINRFVVSTRKTPLERRLANAEYQRNLGNDGSSEGNNLQTGGTISQSLDDILGRTSVVDAESKSITAGQNAGTESSGHVSRQYGYSKGSSSSYVPFVPLPADTFAKKPQSSKAEESENLVTDNHKSVAPEASEQKAPSSGSNLSGMSGESLLLSQKPVIQMENKDKEKEQAEKSERWFKKVAELHDVTDLASAISDEDFPEIMPMRKGENRFVVSKKKDRSLTSPMYKRRMAMEQTGNTNFVPFVPFPPDYFSKKDNQQSDGAVPSKANGETSGSMTSEKLPEKADYSAAPENLQSGTGNWNSTASEVNLTERKMGAVSGVPRSGNATQNFVSPQTTSNNSWSSGYSGKEDTTQTTNMKASVAQPYDNRNPRDSWSGKSLEGSAVKETDPLDMSEEAKAERWFRRAAQIKDISELSQIPDEDFPSIMPMRKGVNRFVVSKRKTPLERRLTSPQYRRNLPIVSSEPLKKENDSS